MTTKENHSFNEDYLRIASGKRLNLSNRPYSIYYVDDMISHFEDCEEYEKCQILSDIRVDLLNHEIGYIK